MNQLTICPQPSNIFDTLWQLLVIPSPFTSLILLRSAISCAYILCRSKRYSKFSLLVIELCIYTIAVKSCTASHCGQSILFPETFFLDLFMWLDECQWRWHEQKHHILWFGLSPYNLPWEEYALGSHYPFSLGPSMKTRENRREPKWKLRVLPGQT